MTSALGESFYVHDDIRLSALPALHPYHTTVQTRDVLATIKYTRSGSMQSENFSRTTGGHRACVSNMAGVREVGSDVM
jgi:hypothetical protein